MTENMLHDRLLIFCYFWWYLCLKTFRDCW